MVAVASQRKYVVGRRLSHRPALRSRDDRGKPFLQQDDDDDQQGQLEDLEEWKSLPHTFLDFRIVSLVGVRCRIGAVEH